MITKACLFARIVTNLHNISVYSTLERLRSATRVNRSSGFPTRSDTNRAVQAQIQEEEKLYSPSSEIKGADQLHSNLEADLRLWFFLHRQKSGFLMTRLISFLAMFIIMELRRDNVGLQSKFSDKRFLLQQTRRPATALTVALNN